MSNLVKLEDVRNEPNNAHTYLTEIYVLRNDELFK